MLDGVLVVRTDDFKNPLEVIFGWSGALLEVAFGCCYELLV
jgi:hypothetical protein